MWGCPSPRGLWGRDLPWGGWVPRVGTSSSPQAFYMVRFHSFYPWHAHGDYLHLCTEEDLRMLPWVRELKCVARVGRGGARGAWPRPPKGGAAPSPPH